MWHSTISKLTLSIALLTAAATTHAVTLRVNCGQHSGLNNIGAALKALQYSDSRAPATILVSGACRENVLIQGFDRLTLTAVNGASISDASGGKLSVVDIEDSRNVALNGFTINAGSGENINGVVCGDWSSCRLSGNVIQGAQGFFGSGVAVFGASQATFDGDVLQNNAIGMLVRSGSKVRIGVGGRPFISRSNGQGISIGRQSFANILATVENNSDQGVIVLFQSTLDFTGSISGNGNLGADVREGSVARFSAAINGNAGPGVLVHDLSMVTFLDGNVTGNGGGTDVVCDPQLPVTRGTADIGAITNCVEP
jgi:hypothetical protein